jgi:hypothetical protein
MSLSATFADVIDFFSFRAFQPAPDDPLVPISKRMAGKTVAYLSIGEAGRTIGTVVFDKTGAPSFRDFKFDSGAVSTQLPNHITAELKARSPEGYVLVSYGFTAELSLSTNVQRSPDVSLFETLASNPAGLLRSADPKYAYSGFYHPSETILLVATSEIEGIEMLHIALASAKLTCIRVQSSHLALFNLILAHPDVKAGQRAAVVYDQGVAFAMPLQTEHWVNPRRRIVAEAAEFESFISEVQLDQPAVLVLATPHGLPDVKAAVANLQNVLLHPQSGQLETAAHAISIL